MLTLSVSTERPPAVTGAREVDVWRDADGVALARAFVGTSHRRVDWPGVGIFELSPPAGVIVWPEAGVPLTTITDTFVRAVQPVLLQSLGWQTLHASAAANERGLTVFCGVSGSGKSTCAYGLRSRGWRQVADDTVVFRVERSCAIAAALPYSVRLRAASREHFRSPADAASAPSVDRPLPIRRIVLLRQDVHHNAMKPDVQTLAPAAAFVPLLVHAHCFDGADLAEKARLVEDYLSLCERVPVLAVTYRPGLDRLGGLLDAVTSLA